MPLTRTAVYVDTEDLALIKEAARSRGIPEAEIIREGVHLAAMATRQRSELAKVDYVVTARAAANGW